MRVTQDVPQMERPDLNVCRISKLNLSDGAWFNSPVSIERFKDFIDLGHLGYYTYLGGKAIFRTWMFTGPEQPLVGKNFRYELSDNELFSGWSLTTEAARGKGVFPYTLNAAIRSLQDSVVSAYIDRNNTASLKGVAKTGFTVIKKILLISVWHLRLQVVYEHMNKKCLRFRFGNVIKSDLK